MHLKTVPIPKSLVNLLVLQEAFLVATACSAAPEGRTRWTMELLAEQLVNLGIVDSISDETVRQTLKKTPNVETLEKEVSIWECDRNQNQVCADWRFRTSDARVKLSKIYPTYQN